MKKENIPIFNIEVRFIEENLNNKPLIMKTDKKGNITYLSSNYLKMSKYSKRDLIGKNHTFIRHPFMPDIVLNEIWENISNKKYWRGILKNLRKDGKYYWTLVEINPFNKKGEFYFSSEEKIEGYIFLEREAKEEEIIKMNEFYNKIKKAELQAKEKLTKIEKFILENL